jgi:hypothetical protein
VEVRDEVGKKHTHNKMTVNHPKVHTHTHTHTQQTFSTKYPSATSTASFAEIPCSPTHTHTHAIASCIKGSTLATGRVMEKGERHMRKGSWKRYTNPRMSFTPHIDTVSAKAAMDKPKRGSQVAVCVCVCFVFFCEWVGGWVYMWECF